MATPVLKEKLALILHFLKHVAVVAVVAGVWESTCMKRPFLEFFKALGIQICEWRTETSSGFSIWCETRHVQCGSHYLFRHHFGNMFVVVLMILNHCWLVFSGLTSKRATALYV